MKFFDWGFFPIYFVYADIVHMLWEADVLVFKAHITTSPDGRVADMFWIHDHRGELPNHHR